MSYLMRDALGRLIPVNPGLPAYRGNQGGMGPTLTRESMLERLPDADIVGARGPGVVPGGEQSVGARRGALAAEDALPPAPTFRPLAGAQQNNRGNIRIVTLGVNTGSPIQTVPSIVETSKNAGDDAETMTIQLGMDLPGPMLDSPASSPYARVIADVTAIIEWGVGGAFFTAEVDWNQGVAIPICASYCRVSARVEAVTGIGSPDVDIVLRASLSYGNAQSLNVSSAARRTVLVADSIAAGAITGYLPIPTWAMGFTLVDAGASVSFPVPDYTIELVKGTSGGSRCVYSLNSRSNVGTQVEGQFPVPGGFRFYRLYNNLGVDVVQPRMIFNLGF